MEPIEAAARAWMEGGSEDCMVAWSALSPEDQADAKATAQVVIDAFLEAKAAQLDLAASQTARAFLPPSGDVAAGRLHERASFLRELKSGGTNDPD